LLAENEQLYEQVIATVFPEGNLPEGWLVHIAGPTENGWRVLNFLPTADDDRRQHTTVCPLRRWPEDGGQTPDNVTAAQAFAIR
jgi:hypothetical protein